MKKMTIASLIMLILFPVHALGAGYTAYANITDDSILNIREKNWIGSKIIGWVLNGGDVEVVGLTSDGWAKVHCHLDDGEYGYIKVDYLTTRPGEDGPYVNATNGRVRIRKSCGGATKGWLKKGAKVVVIGFLKDGKGVEYAYTNRGWIAAECLKKQ